jgi:glycyl-tRNA synthetase alpha subunit
LVIIEREERKKRIKAKPKESWIMDDWGVRRRRLGSLIQQVNRKMQDSGKKRGEKEERKWGSIINRDEEERWRITLEKKEQNEIIRSFDDCSRERKRARDLKLSPFVLS